MLHLEWEGYINVSTGMNQGNFFLEPVRFVLYMSLLRSRFGLLIFFHLSANTAQKSGAQLICIHFI